MTCHCGQPVGATRAGQRWCAACEFRGERIKAELLKIQDQLGAESCTLVIHLKNGRRIAVRPGFDLLAA
jgi:hypothetical protein